MRSPTHYEVLYIVEEKENPGIHLDRKQQVNTVMMSNRFHLEYFAVSDGILVHILIIERGDFVEHWINQVSRIVALRH